MTAEQCNGCTKGMVRFGPPDEGRVKHLANGLCGACYQRRRNRLYSRERPRSVRLFQRSQGLRTSVDDVVVSRLVAGDYTIACTTSEMATAIGRLDGFGLSGRQIAERLGITMRTVTRHRSKRAA